jgi:hypothetical protein
MYKAVLFHPEGDSVSDFYDNTTIQDVQDCIGDMGSRWILYPIAFVVEDEGNDANNIIVDAPYGLEFLIGKTRKEAEIFFRNEWKERAEEICENMNKGVPLFLIY